VTSGDEFLASGLIIDPRFYENWTFKPFGPKGEEIEAYTTSHVILLVKESEEFPFSLLLTGEQGEDYLKPPGGEAYPGESPLKTALRELREETGITDVKLQGLGIVHFPKRDEIVPLFVGILDTSAQFGQVTDPKIDRIAAVSYTFFHSKLVETKTGDAALVALALNQYLHQIQPGLSLYSSFQMT